MSGFLLFFVTAKRGDKFGAEEIIEGLKNRGLKKNLQQFLLERIQKKEIPAFLEIVRSLNHSTTQGLVLDRALSHRLT
jgi:hypothetical protein